MVLYYILDIVEVDYDRVLQMYDVGFIEMSTLPQKTHHVTVTD